MDNNNYHKILGISVGASKLEIKSAYRKLAKKFHPDKNNSKQAHEMFVKINEAYAFLSNDKHDFEPLSSKKTSFDNLTDEELKKRMEWARNYARMKKIWEERIVEITYLKLQRSALNWVVPLFSWLSIGLAVLILLDFKILTTTEEKVKINSSYTYSGTDMLFLSLKSIGDKKQTHNEFAIEMDDISIINSWDNNILLSEFTPLFNQEVYLSFYSDGVNNRIFNHYSVYEAFYIYLFLLLSPIITILTKGPNFIHVFSVYIITSLVGFVMSLLLVSLLA